MFSAYRKFTYSAHYILHLLHTDIYLAAYCRFLLFGDGKTRVMHKLLYKVWCCEMQALPYLVCYPHDLIWEFITKAFCWSVRVCVLLKKTSESLVHEMHFFGLVKTRIKLFIAWFYKTEGGQANFDAFQTLSHLSAVILIFFISKGQPRSRCKPQNTSGLPVSDNMRFNWHTLYAAEKI